MKTLRSLTLSAVALVLALPAFAQNPGPTVKVDTDASRVFIRVNRTNRLGHNHGVEGMLAEGTLTLGGAGKLVFDMNTFNADTARARQFFGFEGSGSSVEKVNANMRGGEVLDVGQFPKATCTITSILPVDKQAPGAAGRYVIDGQFTLHGVTQNVRFLTELQATNTAGVTKLVGWFKIKQTDYGIKPYSVAGGTIGIEDELEIHGDLLLRESK
jgi:hypothetical protein